MMRLPGQLANRPDPFPPGGSGGPGSDSGDGGPGELAGLDLARAAGRVGEAGGDVTMFRAAVAAGVVADPAGRADPAAALDVVALAAWRSGALALRQDALRRLGAMLGRPGGRAAAAAALALHPADLAEFAARQAGDPLFWPGRAAAGGYVLSVGGFLGIGGAWIRPADTGFPLDAPGAFALRVAGTWWLLDCDVFGAALRPAPGPPPAPGLPPVVGGAARVVLPPATHLAWIHVAEPG